MEYRTHTCGELRESNVGQKVKLSGWLAGTRDLGAVIFFVLRDFTAARRRSLRRTG